MTQRYCKVRNCNYSQFHTTRSHKCGKCEKFGHGQIECDEFLRIQRLQRYYYDKMPLEEQCSITNCMFKEYHSIESHQCSNCNEFKHSIYTCPVIGESASSMPPVIDDMTPTTYQPPPQTTYIPPMSSPTYGGPMAPASSYDGPMAPASSYDGPMAPASSYGVPMESKSSYGGPMAPASSYGGPMESASLYGGADKKYKVTCYICKDKNDYDKTKIHVKADCGVCLVNNVDFVFPCGHTCCETCFDSPYFSKWVKLN